MIQLRDYQEKAVIKLKNAANELLVMQGNKTIVFKAPTGSGKTVMVAEFLKSFVENRPDNKTFSFIWTAPRKLHLQSKEKLEDYFEDTRALKCCFFEDLTDKRIDENEILFLNWQSINQADNIYIRENEQDFNLSNVIEKTLDEDRIIVLIIDESHHTSTTDNSKGLIDMFRPKITVEMSATPVLQGDERITVHREEVILEEMIKKQIAINPDFKNIISGESDNGVIVQSEAKESTNEFVIKVALTKREELAKAYQDIGSSVNPLMLIQLPDRRRGAEDVKDEMVEILKEKHNITTDNERLAIYLSEDKENLETITKKDSGVEVMIFKQAIALGWDCPRASILALFRDWRSIIFSIQTVGRILRMPELKHYKNDELNIGYVYTNLSDISIHKDVAGNYVTINHSKRKELYQNIELLSFHSKRFREITRLSPKFISLFLGTAKELNLKRRIAKDVTEIRQKLITDGLITVPDEEFDHLQTQPAELFPTHTGDTVQRVQTDKEVQSLFDNFVIESISPLYPDSRSIDRVKQSIYRFFTNEFPMEFEFGGVNAQMVVLEKGNNQHFIDVINRAKDLYLEEVQKREKELVRDDNWEVPTSVNFSDEYVLKEKSLTILDPFYERESASTVEKKFADFLDNKPNEIDWWFKNSERDGTFFAIPYTNGNETKIFYVDWIVKYKDGRIGLFDTKAGIYAETAKSRAEGLAKYIKEQNEKAKNLFGGIVILRGGSWYLNDNDVYDYDESDLRAWKVLS